MKRRAYIGLLWLALAWALFNTVYVYFVLDGTKTYRIESAIILLLALLIPIGVATATGPPRPIQISRRLLATVVAVVVTFWLALHVPLIDFPFLSDDYVFLDLYNRVDTLGQAPQFFRPLFALVFWALTRISSSTVPFHLTSLALHLASAYFVYRLSERLFGGNGQALVCFTAFLLNPLQLEAVLWVSGLQEALWAFFVLSALAIYTGAERLSRGRSVVTVLLVGLGLASKETAVCAVLLLPAAEWVLFGAKRLRDVRLMYILLAGEMVAYFVIRSRFVELESTYFVEPDRYFLKQFFTTPYRVFAQPWNISVADVPSIAMWAAATTAIGLLFWTIVGRRQSRELWCGAFIIIASTLPVYSYFFVREDLLSARYVYFAAFGWGVILAALICSVVRTPHWIAAATLSLAILMTVSLDLNLRPWRVAAQVVNVMSAAISENESPTTRLAEWTTRNNVQLLFRGSVPYEYGGVGIFINGYDGFLRHVQRLGRR
jgi:hypothetical protein